MFVTSAPQNPQEAELAAKAEATGCSFSLTGKQIQRL